MLWKDIPNDRDVEGKYNELSRAASSTVWHVCFEMLWFLDDGRYCLTDSW